MLIGTRRIRGRHGSCLDPLHLANGGAWIILDGANVDRYRSVDGIALTVGASFDAKVGCASEISAHRLMCLLVGSHFVIAPLQ
jgi:hypothetical protein